MRHLYCKLVKQPCPAGVHSSPGLSIAGLNKRMTRCTGYERAPIGANAVQGGGSNQGFFYEEKRDAE
jgi:hypothetical protein